MSHWEYRIVDLDGGGGFLSGGGEQVTEQLLNEMGQDGWELVTSLTGSERSLGGRPKSTTEALVFKREVE